MRYLVILFLDDSNVNKVSFPVKINVSRSDYELINDAGNKGLSVIITDKKQDYEIVGNQRCFNINDGMEIFLIADAKKVNK